MEQLERIQKQEQNLDLAAKAVRDLEDAFSKYLLAQDALAELSDYYQADVWMSDYEDDESGLLPPELKRGVLSEDGIYNVLTDNRDLLIRINDITSELLQKETE
ncbi:MAG: DUF4298 domain-containing protein [Oscillospiraceae bacterium]|nr:DUF4298 domain-containing protein [Oscillospiraceae bacterium]